jgi:hypothetical protein
MFGNQHSNTPAFAGSLNATAACLTSLLEPEVALPA